MVPQILFQVLIRATLTHPTYDDLVPLEVTLILMFGYILSKVRAMLMYPMKDLPWPA